MPALVRPHLALRMPGSLQLAAGFTLLVLGLVPSPVSAERPVSCLVRSADPVPEWTLVDPASLDPVIADETSPLHTVLAPAAGWMPRPEDAGVAPVLTGSGTPAPGEPSLFMEAWLPITIGELSLLTVTAMLPKDWTGWSADFVGEGAGNLAEAWTRPPIMDSDHWFHNYVGHPYGGGFYYNSVRCRGASPMESMAFAAVLSAQWEYVFEAVAERPSIQDLVITPIAGAAYGELTHHLVQRMRRGRVTFPEKVAMTILNPANVLAHGYKSTD